MTDTPEYRAWTDMRSRCNNPKATAFSNYGGRGIKHCAAWASFSAFYAALGQKPTGAHTLERDDVNGDYEPHNCRWATRAEQAANRRNTIRVATEGGTARVPELACATGLSHSGMWLRVKRGASNVMRGSKRRGWVTFNGVTDTYVGWSKRTGIKPSTIAMRLTKYGWSLDKALTQGASLCASTT